MEPNENITSMHREITYTLDGESFVTTERRQLAAAILGRGELDPASYDLGELVGGRPAPKRYTDDEEVTIRPGARFVSIRHKADVA